MLLKCPRKEKRGHFNWKWYLRLDGQCTGEAIIVVVVDWVGASLRRTKPIALPGLELTFRKTGIADVMAVAPERDDDFLIGHIAYCHFCTAIDD